MIRTGVEQEIAWGRYVLGNRISGLTEGMIDGYIRYLGNLRSEGLGLGTLYPEHREEPHNMAWVREYSSANMMKTDFFEAKPSAYTKAGAITDDL